MELDELLRSLSPTIERAIRRGFGVREAEVADLVQDVALLACERWARGDRPTADTAIEWGERLAHQVLGDRERAWEIRRVVLRPVSLETPVIAHDEESLTIGDLLADPLLPEAIVTSRESVRELGEILCQVGRAPADLVQRQRWRALVAERCPSEIPVEIVCGVCPVCAGPVHRDRDGHEIAHRCPGPWRRVAPANDLPVLRDISGLWKHRRTCLLCDRPVLRGRAYCTTHKRWGGVRARSYSYHGQPRTIEGGRRHLCAWCGKRWARANRPYCGLPCTLEARRARHLQEANRGTLSLLPVHAG